MSNPAQGQPPRIVAVPSSAFAMPQHRRRVGSGEAARGETPGRLLTMLAIAFLLASPVITLLVVAP